MMHYFTKQLSSIEISFYNLLAGNENFSFILFPEKIEGDLGYFRFLDDGNLLHKEKAHFSLAIKSIAKFHFYSRSIDIGFLPKNQGYYRESYQNSVNYALQNGIALPEKQMGEIEASLATISEDTFVIHDDLLPQNCMIEGDDVRIIDWADMRFGFPEHDIGRFLSDIEAENLDWRKKYYPTEWKNELIQQYLEVRKQLDSSYDIQRGKEFIRLGEMWNYLGPIEMCLKNGDIESKWFQENLKALHQM